MFNKFQSVSIRSHAKPYTKILKQRHLTDVYHKLSVSFVGLVFHDIKYWKTSAYLGVCWLAIKNVGKR